ncbi:S8 family serine peptidase [Conexibacter sp. CPCC 206217]|uniref:S8 family serine peptidase n=1 Tax=Conexibacter sp. CPCC 206217 TaxID=3064574 RepID=UPI00271E31C7|nr:S8 family serine peptidase [Conexibacter sp. CPCC 206217]MDO8209894.1 S8 family serine peptidase [Conexibacter sp. CPCC 206217]
MAAASNGGAPAYVPGEVVVGYHAHVDAEAQASTARAVGAAAPGANTRVLHVPVGRVRATIAKLRRQPGVAYAAPNPIAHISGGPSGGATAGAGATKTSASAPSGSPTGSAWSKEARTSILPLPDDPGIKNYPGGLAAVQWNFFGPRGVGALEAWTNAIVAGAEGGRGVRIAVLDTGVAYRDLGRFKKSPDFANTKFVAPYDFVENRREAVDRNGHGTHVAGTIAEATNNRIGVSGLAYGATVMPVRVLDSQGYGDAATIAKGIRYAARHNAKVINMSLEFSTSVRSSEIPDIMSAIRYANELGAVVVGSTGNEGEAQVAYPARAALVVSVGATTDQGCLASFSNDGIGLDIVAPGGGDNATLSEDPNCQPNRAGHDIFQMTYAGSVGRFGLPSGYDGTSMAAPHVSAAAALVIATKVIGPNPTPAQVECRLKATATQLGIASPNRIYGWGLVNAGAATSPAIASPSCLSRSSSVNPSGPTGTTPPAAG